MGVLSEAEMAVYRATARRRRELDEQELTARRQRAWEAARRAAMLLREDFGAERVVVFGSLLRPHSFNKWSDVDIAAWGISSKDTFRALGAVMDLSADIEMNFVDIETCHAALRATIEREGQDI